MPCSCAAKPTAASLPAPGDVGVLKDALHLPRLQPQGLTLGYDHVLGAGGPHRTRRAHAGRAQQVHVPPSNQFMLPGLNLSDLLQNPSAFSRRLVQGKASRQATSAAGFLVVVLQLCLPSICCCHLSFLVHLAQSAASLLTSIFSTGPGTRLKTRSSALSLPARWHDAH